MRILGSMAAIAILVAALTGDLAGGWERNTDVMVFGILVAGAILVVCMPKGLRRWVLVLGAIVAVGAWVGFG